MMTEPYFDEKNAISDNFRSKLELLKTRDYFL